MKKIQMTLITALTFVMMCSASWAATYYIDGKIGNDANTGSKSAPWKTIIKANNTLKAGDTVYIKKGTYKETIRPSSSGKNGSYITYARYGNDEVIITDVSNGVNLVDRSYVVIDGLKILNVRGEWVEMRPNGCHNIIQNCHMEENNVYRGINIDEGANYNKIINNTLIGKCNPDDLIVLRDSHHNLIEGNKMYYGPHNAMRIHDTEDGSTNYNVIRNNYIQNRWHSIFGIKAVEYILIENNILSDGGEDAKDNSCGSERDRNMARVEHKGIGLETRYAIVRNNISVRNGYGIALTSGDGSGSYPWKQPEGNNRIYNNVMTRNHTGIRRNDGDPLISAPSFFKNNIVYNNTDYEIYINGPNDPDNVIYITNNNIFGSKTKYDSSKCVVKGNLSINPLFVDESNRDFHLKSNSPMRDAGTWLTTIKSNTGSGTSFVVDDSRYFMDGWGIINGDMIQLQGSKKTARITSIDYKTNTITVDTELSWDRGTGVSLPYNGEKPDMGAYEYGDVQTDNMLVAPENLRVVKADLP